MNKDIFLLLAKLPLTCKETDHVVLRSGGTNVRGQLDPRRVVLISSAVDINHRYGVNLLNLWGVIDKFAA